MTAELTREILDQLSEPFREDQVRWKPQVISESGNALAVAYVDPRVVSERLDHVVGGNWSFHWEPIGVQGDRLVIKSSLTIMGVTREDVGEYGLTERDMADPWKSAVSDSLKRAAVHFGVGRYLYWLESVWCSYDRRKKEFIDVPYIDAEGNARVRRRGAERDRVPADTRDTDRPAQAQPVASRPASAAPARSAAAQTGTPANGARGTRLQEAAPQSAYGVPWGEDLIKWAGRYLEHQGLGSERPADVLQWLVQHEEMQADLSAYAALSDAQAAFIRGVPKYVKGQERAA
jgi:hypothetical protein